MAKKTWKKITKETADTVMDLKTKGLSNRKIAKYMGRTTVGIAAIVNKLNKSPNRWDHIVEPDDHLWQKRTNSGRSPEPKTQMDIPIQKTVPSPTSSSDHLLDKLVNKYLDSLSPKEKYELVRIHESRQAT